MEVIRFWGIKFRSANHKYWFIFTVTVLSLDIFCSIFLAWGRDKDYLIMAAFLNLVLALASLQVSISAAIKTGLGRINGETWSSDCIWFNGLLAAVYLAGAVIFFLFHWRS